ncbi:MAG: hypothetical protein K1X94_31405 [Sandaracinaceae bacterium]|nr:hypothetical protein [Sandaracinaceae bacterium]
MRRVASVLVGSILVGLVGVGCDCGGTPGDGDAGGGGIDAFLDPTLDANVDAFVDPTIDTGATPGTDAFVDPTVDANVDAWLDPTMDAGPGSCHVAQCAGRTYQCGDCIDNDGDGVGDAADPGCIGPCDDTEDVYDIAIGDTPTCLIDCYYDEDQGPGNDGCRYDSSCDPLEPDAPRCPYDPGAMCDRIDPVMCGSVCGPLVPNGCDCLGCCELPAGSGVFVYLGSEPVGGAPPCSPETVGNPDSCRRCTPVRTEGCFNECGHCELCLGRTELPADCFPPPPVDAGVPPGVDAGPTPDAWTPDDAYVPDSGTPIMRCPAGQQACGLPTDPPCPSTAPYCLTGCCIDFG